jgi:RimJ/RimL family protein N-acetyltransferase
MPFYHGPPYQDGAIRIGTPDVARILQSDIAGDVRGDVEHYLACAPAEPTLYYFSIYQEETPVGQIVLHDINHETGESLVGYCLFTPAWRGRGIGTRALRLLQRYVTELTGLTHLVIITGVDNLPSQHIAQKCGFLFAGGAREDPEQLVVYEWRVQRFVVQ